MSDDPPVIVFKHLVPINASHVDLHGFRRNPVILWQDNYSALPAGKVHRIEHADKILEVEGELRMWFSDHLFHTTSWHLAPGFKVIEEHFEAPPLFTREGVRFRLQCLQAFLLGEPMPKGRRVFDSVELLELSVYPGRPELAKGKEV